MLEALESIEAQLPPYQQEALAEIKALDRQLERQFEDRLRQDGSLSRALVSFQANKTRPVYRWYKYKEAFSAALVEHFLRRCQVTSGPIFDPFAGSGTALFAAAGLGLDAEGIELLPIGQQIIDAKQTVDNEFAPSDFDALRRWAAVSPWRHATDQRALPELRITRGAYPAATKEAIERYLYAMEQEPEQVRRVLRFALLCVLESVSFTRKDGQYLRWDYRSGRRQGKKRFDKGAIPDFDDALAAKLWEIIEDATTAPIQPSLFSSPTAPGTVRLLAGSCLELLPRLPAAYYSALITSPPYCNRYDYTRTYALELALLGASEKEVTALRQAMLSSTVENRPKALLHMNPAWQGAIAAVDGQTLLQRVLDYLEESKSAGDLNNNGIPRMVRGYFYEMTCVIAECARVLRPGAPLIMVNDNVRYAGASISADLILSDLAEQLGFAVEDILILPGGKGNSSQQMGQHGRAPLRKCVYVWRKR